MHVITEGVMRGMITSDVCVFLYSMYRLSFSTRVPVHSQRQKRYYTPCQSEFAYFCYSSRAVSECSVLESFSFSNERQF